MRPAAYRVAIAVLVVTVLAVFLAGCPKANPPAPSTTGAPVTSAVPKAAPTASTPPATGGAGPAWVTGMEAGKEKATAQKKPMMVDFYADWCSWCKKLDEETYTDATVMEKAKAFVCVKVNADEDKASATKYKAEGLPTIVFLDASGNEIHRVTGFEPAPEFATEMQTALDKVKAG